MHIYRISSLALILALLNFPAFSADINIAKVQTKLKLLGFEPGPIDGLTGLKTQSAIKSFTNETEKVGSDISDVDSQLSQKIHQDAKFNHSKNIFSTTSNYTEMQSNEAYFLLGDDFYKNDIEPEFSGLVSKWYFANVTGDDENELVVFGINDIPLVFQKNISQKVAENCVSGSKILVFAKGKEDFNGNLRYTKLDSDLIFGPEIRSFGDTVTLTSDFNGDGYSDFFIPSESDICSKDLDNWWKGTRDVLLMSQNGAGYKDVTSNYDWLINDTFRHWAASGDIDNDGDIDFITSHLGKGSVGDRVECYINAGDGSFDEVECIEPSNLAPNRMRSWGGTIMDVNNDGYLDLIYSGTEKTKPVIMLGDGTGQFSYRNSINLFLPDNWKKIYRQFGGLWAADVDNDGWQDLLFSVQATSKTVSKGTKCKGYCGTAAGWFRNDHGFLDFQEYILEFESDEPADWPATSLFSVGNYVRAIENGKINDNPMRPKDIWLRRNYYGKSAPFFQLDKNTGKYLPTEYEGFLITVPRIVSDPLQN